MSTIWEDVAATALATFVRETTWAYPVLETLHMIGLGLLFGGIFALDLRLLGSGRGLDVTRLARHVLPWVWTGFAINAVSGGLLFMSDAVEFAANTSFRIKIVLIALAGANALLFHARVYRSVATWEAGLPPPAARLFAVLSLVLWIGVITAGRMMAYIK